MPTLLNREIVYLRGDESCSALYVTLVEDLMYRHNQEFGEGIEDCMELQIGIRHDESRLFASTRGKRRSRPLSKVDCGLGEDAESH
jgi:hypothetical protein